MQPLNRKQTQKILDDLQQKIKQANPDDTLAELVLARGQKGILYASTGQWQQSAAEFEELAQLAQERDEPAGRAMARYGQAVALFHLPDKQTEAKAALQETVAITQQLEGLETLAAKAHFILYSFYLEAEDLPGALSELNQALSLLDAEREAQFAVQIYQTRASLHLLQGEVERAQTDLAQALAIARQAGDTQLALSLQVDKQILQGFSPNPTGAANPANFLNGLLAQANTAGYTGVASEIKLQQAISFLQTGNLKAALKRAGEVRREALQTAGHLRYIRYLLACIIMAEAYDRQGQRVETLATLLTCKGSLEGALGKPAGQLVVPFLDALHYRWGATALQAALQKYNQRMAQTGAASQPPN